MDFLCKKYSATELISGGSKGADYLAEIYAKERNIPIKIFPAKWDTYGNKAGYLRNVKMHEYLITTEERLCVCFWGGESHGTAQNFKLCQKFNTELICYNYNKHMVIKEENKNDTYSC